MVSVSRIGPKAVSVPEAAAVPKIYALNSGFIKSDFYNVQQTLANGRPLHALFNTTDEKFHAKLRRAVSNAYSISILVQFEPYVDSTTMGFLHQIETRYADRPGYSCDFGTWLQYYAFDVIVELTYSQRLGFLRGGADVENIVHNIEWTLNYSAVVSWADALACPNIETYLVADIFDAIGDTALLITEQIFVADITSLINRGFWSALPEATTGIFSLYVGSRVAQAVLDHSTWRWGYDMWTIIIPVCAISLFATLMIYERRALRQLKGTSIATTDPTIEGSSSYLLRVSRFIRFELDLLDAILLAAGFSLISVPLSLTGSYSSSGKWPNGGFVAMVVVGAISLILFGIWDGRFVRRPIMAYRLLKNRTVVAGCLLGAFDFASYSVFTMLFPSYLQVAANYAAREASRPLHCNNSLIVAYQVARILTGILLRFTKRPNLWIFFGVPLCVLGQGLMTYFTNMPGGHPANKVEFVTSKALVGVSRGMYHTASKMSVQAVVTQQDVAVTTAIFLSFMTIGSPIGQSIGGAIWRHIQPQKLEKYLPAGNKSSAASIYGSIAVDKKYPEGTPSRDVINRAFRESTSTLAIAATAVVAPIKSNNQETR
ncbi:uncharacterized protein Z518_00274 [Rhinocladiella mackenziei CBS 650.93]|uniref:Major facilitator superfamily (MFS) profile domain-containing protein n=1 Tax=Rhinocladiella mackenziei CBS 650.93 TaxID=1442369 RepID=A0A0D2JIE7_9EURO|nr:uncharacterized protein Z518_00274 [Rhinocladiella mackenziei CBS 650.93]KIX09195.1 hypothetical protein Z518_00274 [Rhinocladiella mackenziei CBS 650.93]